MTTLIAFSGALFLSVNRNARAGRKCPLGLCSKVGTKPTPAGTGFANGSTPRTCAYVSTIGWIGDLQRPNIRMASLSLSVIGRFGGPR